MGAWGTSLYANDAASDIRGDYVDGLRRGGTNDEVTQKLIERNQGIMGDVEEEPLFWFALADTQWNYGRLLPEVKEKALYFLSQEGELARWKESGEKQLKAWQQTLEKLKKKLLSSQPGEKKISQYRLYHCKWQFGDVFAYRFSSEFSKEKGFFGKYFVFRKVSESDYWPGHIVPVVQVYKWIGAEIPSLDALADLPLLEQGFYPSVLVRKPNVEKEYFIKLLSTSERVIPKKNLYFLGNVPGDDLVFTYGEWTWFRYADVGWGEKKWNNKLEHYIIDMYLSWKDIGV